MNRLLALVLALGLAAGVDAKTFKFADQGDVVSMDPYFFNESFLINFTGNIYESLTRYDKMDRSYPFRILKPGPRRTQHFPSRRPNCR